MVLRKITFDNSVRYIPIREKTNETNVKRKKIIAGSFPRKQKKIFRKTMKSFLKNTSAQGFKYLK